MSYNERSFKQYLQLKENKRYFLLAIVISIVYFFTLRFLFPVPSYYSDSYTWIGAARTGQPVTFRPVGYSKIIEFLQLLGKGDFLLIFTQYFLNLFANLLLFFTSTYFFTFKSWLKKLLFLFLIANPFYLFYSNYISSDAFFNSITVVWFTLLMWIFHKPKWSLLIAKLILLAILFELRYNAIFFPVISGVAILLTSMPMVKKITGIGLSLVLIVGIMIATTIVTENFTGTKTFSAFSGWQLANDALHIMQHEKIDTNKIESKEVKALTGFLVHFFDTARQTFPDSGATAVFMWHINSPLKRYMRIYDRSSKSYFKTWNEVGPLYNEFGKIIILQKPLAYIQHFVLPNAKANLLPPLEIYDTYMEDHDTIAAVASKYFAYSSNRTRPHHPKIYALVFKPMQYLFVCMNIVLLLFGNYYLWFDKYQFQPKLYNYTLLCFAAFFVANFFFIVLLAPTVFRYHVFILTLSFPILLFLLQQIILTDSAFKIPQDELID